jgi:hypothetical protein
MHGKPGAEWSCERVDATEKEYRRFLLLMKMLPNELAAPSMDVDRFWHHHILDTKKYANDCRAVFGYFLHHYPYLGLGGEEDQTRRLQAGKRMRELHREVFGPQQASADLDQQADGFALAGQATPPDVAIGESDFDPASSLVSYCAAPGDRVKDAAAFDGPGIGAVRQRPPTWLRFGEPDETNQIQDLLAQIRFVVTENQRYDRVAEPVS